MKGLVHLNVRFISLALSLLLLLTLLVGNSAAIPSCRSANYACAVVYDPLQPSTVCGSLSCDATYCCNTALTAASSTSVTLTINPVHAPLFLSLSLSFTAPSLQWGQVNFLCACLPAPFHAVMRISTALPWYLLLSVECSLFTLVCAPAGLPHGNDPGCLQGPS